MRRSTLLLPLALLAVPTLLAAQAAAPAHPDAGTVAKQALDAATANGVAIDFVWTRASS